MSYIIKIHKPNQESTTKIIVFTLDDAADVVEQVADEWLDTIPDDQYGVAHHFQYRQVIEAWHRWDDDGGAVDLPDGTSIAVELQED